MSFSELLEFIDRAAGCLKSLQVSQKQFNEWAFEAHAKFCWGPPTQTPPQTMSVKGVVITPAQNAGSSGYHLSADHS